MKNPRKTISQGPANRDPHAEAVACGLCVRDVLHLPTEEGRRLSIVANKTSNRQPADISKPGLLQLHARWVTFK